MDIARRQACASFPFIGEQPALDFVDTARDECCHEDDLLETYKDLAAWCTAAGFLATGDRERLLAFEGSRDAARVLHRARRFRSTLETALARLVEGHALDQDVIAETNELLGACGCPRQVVRDGEGYHVVILYRYQTPADLLMPIANAAAELFTKSDLSLVKRCRNARCSMFFLDRTKNHTRAWCNMRSCGNRAKVAAHYRRTRSGVARGANQPRDATGKRRGPTDRPRLRP